MWKELTKIALLGTERSALSESTKKELETFGIPIKNVDTQIVLAGAGFYSQMNKAGFILKDFPHQNSIINQIESGNVCSPKSTKHLQLILDGTFEDALPEFIFHLNKNKRELSPNNLPDLLDKCIESEEFYQKLKPVIGTRGKWLIAQNPVWKNLQYFPVPEDWSSTNLQQRVKFLKFYRENDPQGAIEILEVTWDKESPQNKVSFLKTFEVGLSEGDESFLENALYDSRKEVRQIAADLLTVLLDSELVERMFIRVQDLIRFKKNELKVFIPNELDETAIRDGIDLKTKREEGEGAGVLRQMIAKIPPQRWGHYFNDLPENVLKLFLQNQWAQPLIQGVFEATLIHKNKTWSKALLSLYLQKRNTLFWGNLPIKKLVALISNKDFNEITIQYLTENRQILGEKSPIMLLLLNSQHNWSDSLSMMVVGRFRNWVTNSTSYHWDKWHYKTLLKNTAYRCDPKLFEKLKNGWNRQSPVWGMWEGEVETFLKILIFRKEMIGELEID